MSAADIVLRATLLVALAWLAAAALRMTGAPAAVRHLAWLLGFAALLLLPPLMAVLPSVPLPILPQAETGAGSYNGVASAGSAPPGALRLAYLAVAVVLLARIAVGRLVLARMWRAARPAGAGWQALLVAAAQDVQLGRPVRLRLAQGAMPMTWGTLAPKLLLPAEADGWTQARKRRVLLHELAHVRRRDSLGQAAASLACALYWFHPAVWVAARRLRLEQEHAADDFVLAAGAEAPDYARDLLALAHGLMSAPVSAAATQMAGASQLERRLSAILAGTNGRAASPASMAAIAAAALAGTLLAAAAVPIPPVPPQAVRTPLPAPLASAHREPAPLIPAVAARAARPERPPARAGQAAPAGTNGARRLRSPAVPAVAPLPIRPVPPAPAAVVPPLPIRPVTPPTPPTPVEAVHPTA